MAIRNVITGGIGLNNDVIGWVVTLGFGDFGEEESTTPDYPGYGYAFRNRTVEEPRLIGSGFLKFRKG